MTERQLGWDEPIENDGQEFTLFPAGTEGAFIVTEFKKALTGPNASVGPNVPQAQLKIKFTGDAGGTTTLTDKITLHTTSEWKLCQFFRAIGQRVSGQKIKPDWSKVNGAVGRCRLKVREYVAVKGDKRGQTMQTNDIDKYLDIDDKKHTPFD